MSYTKKQFVKSAFEEIGVAAFDEDINPEHMDYAVRRLDAMIGRWNKDGIRLSYPFASSPESIDPNTDTEIPNDANEAVITNLAIRVASAFGESVAQELKDQAKSAYDTLLQDSTTPLSMQLPATMPRGAGHKPWRQNSRRFQPQPKEPVLGGQDGEIEFN